MQVIPRSGVLFALLSSLAAQTTVSLPCAADNTLYESATGSLSNGAGPGLYVGITGQPGVRRSLLRFDLTVIPANAVVLAASLRINTVQTSFGGLVDVYGHRALRAWGEGTSVAPGGGGGGTAATTGDATWLHTFYPNTLWTNPGGDFAATSSFTITTPPFGLASSAPSNAMVADVQAWIASPAANYGWLLKTNEALAYVTRKIDSRQTQFGTPPSLSVTYVLPGQNATIGTGCPGNGAPFAYAFVGAPTGGSTVTMQMSNGPIAALAANMLSLGYAPAGSLPLPQCMAYLPLNLVVLHSIGFTDGTGSLGTPFPVPAGYAGLPIFAQAAALDPTTPLGFTLSNGVASVLQ